MKKKVRKLPAQRILGKEEADVTIVLPDGNTWKFSAIVTDLSVNNAEFDDVMDVMYKAFIKSMLPSHVEVTMKSCGDVKFIPAEVRKTKKRK